MEKKYKISRDDLSFLDINTILSLHDNLDSISIINNLKDLIIKNKKIYKSNSLMYLPETITGLNDLYSYEKKIFQVEIILLKKKLVGKYLN